MKMIFPVKVTFFLVSNGFKNPKVIMMIVVGSEENPPTFWGEFDWMRPACSHLVQFLRSQSIESDEKLSQEPISTEGRQKVVIAISSEFVHFTQPPNVSCVVIEDEHNCALFETFSTELDSLQYKLVGDMFGL
jgi:hypothetical protein